MTYKFRAWYIPDRMMPGIERYITHGIQPGSFLTALLSNDLHDAISRADDENMNNLPAYVAFLHNEAPRGCYGSPEDVTEWIQMGGLEGISNDN